jgi:hypothetical protein
MFAGYDTEVFLFPQWGTQKLLDIPFLVANPEGGKVNNAIVLQSNQGGQTLSLPQSVQLPCGSPARVIHLLSGMSGWGYPTLKEKTLTLTVRLHYEGGIHEDHPLYNGVHFADFHKANDVPGSKLALTLGDSQVRYLALRPRSATTPIKVIEFINGDDAAAPVVLAVTLEQLE